MKKFIFGLLLIIIFSSFYISQNKAVETLSRQGSRGQEVIDIQTKLKQLGYYSYTVDGIYGFRTTDAVRRFQRAKGLVADGVAGPQTLKALGLSTNTNNNLNLLARVINAEARGEPYKGQVAVGAVVLNRVKHPSFPNSIAGVIYQPGAFTSVNDGQINLQPSDTAIKAAQDALNGWDPTYGCIYFYNPAKTTNTWILSRPVVIVIGKHKFAK